MTSEILKSNGDSKRNSIISEIELSKILRSDGQLIPQRLKNIYGITSREAYKIVYNVSPKCKVCGKEPRYLNFRKGFDDFCSKECKTIFRKTLTQEILDDIVIDGKIDKKKFQKYYITEKQLYDFNNDKGRCKVCGKEATFISFEKGYKQYCSKCVYSSSEILEKRKKTCIEKYGVENTFQSEDIKVKIKKTCLEKYGVIYFRNSNQYKESLLKTCLEKYGVDHFSQTEEYKSKCKQTCLERYGDENFKNTEKIKKTCLEKYGVFASTQRHLDMKTINVLNSPELLKMTENNSYLSIANKLGVTYRTIINHLGPNVKLKNKSQSENDINQIVNGIQNDRTLIKPLEIDILSNEYKFGIEYDGLMFHSEGISRSSMFNKPTGLKAKHLHKTELCEEKGYQLFHIFDNEWIDPVKQEIWKSVIRNKMGQNTIIQVTNCSIKEVSRMETKKFLEANHLQGYDSSSINIGLWYNDSLIQIMTFSKVQDNYEMVKLCSKIGLSIQDGASRLLKYFERNYNPKMLICSANRRWSDKQKYIDLGFKLDHETGPNYFYFLPNIYKLESRNKFKSYKLLENYDPNLSEVQNMFNNGYRRIWDCGNYIFTKVCKGGACEL